MGLMNKLRDRVRFKESNTTPADPTFEERSLWLQQQQHEVEERLLRLHEHLEFSSLRRRLDKRDARDS